MARKGGADRRARIGSLARHAVSLLSRGPVLSVRVALPYRGTLLPLTLFPPSMNTFHLSLAALLGANALLAQSTMSPVATFGTNGWLAPGSASYIGSANNERGFAYNPVTGNLVLVSRTGGTNIKVLNGSTGADLGTLVSTGITGGTFTVNMAGVADDGSIYVGNLSTSAPAPFKIYKWDSEALGLANAPTVAYNNTSVIARVGDSFAVTGGSGGNPIRFAAAGTVPSGPANSSFLTGQLDAVPTNLATAYTSIPGTLTTSNDYRLSLTFIDQDTIIGNQGTNARITSFGASATIDASIPLSAAQRPLDYAVIGGVPCLAVIDSNSSLVVVYDITVPSAPLQLTSGNLTSGALTANANGVGSVQWGAISGNSATLYAMSCNQGIQAFNVTIDQPARATAFGVGCGSPALALAASARPVLGTTINLNVSNLAPTMPITVYALGFAEIPGGITLPIQPFTCTAYLATIDVTFLNFSGGAPTDTLPLAFPNDPFFSGQSVFGQAVGLDVNNDWITTNGLRMFMKTF